MITTIKRWLYFPIAYYFAFWARIQLALWKPKIVVITGSSGKTTLLHLIESQVPPGQFRYSHHANSSYGIPFDILDLHRRKLTFDEWIGLFLLAPWRAFKKPDKEKVYVVEADCDRADEGKFLSRLLKPDITLWLNVSRTHSAGFDRAVVAEKFKTVDEGIAYEYGYFLESTRTLCMVNGDAPLIKKQLSRTKAETIEITKRNLKKYKVNRDSTEFEIGKNKYCINKLLPQETFYAVEATRVLLKYLKQKVDPTFKNFYLPPGRSSMLEGIKNTTIIDSSYNANFDSMKAILNLYGKYPAEKKWVVLGDMIEQGRQEREEHEKLAGIIVKLKTERIILMGPRMIKYTYPKLKEATETPIITFTNPAEVLDYLRKNLKGGETILFKGARFLEGVIEHLLKNKSDIKNLCRREEIWERRRKRWEL